MDISQLLSPQDSPATETPPPLPAQSSQLSQSPAIRPQRQIPSRTPSGLAYAASQRAQRQVNFQQQQYQQHNQQQFHHQAQSQYIAAIPSPGVAEYSNGRSLHSATHTPPSSFDMTQRASPRSLDARSTPPHPLHRQASTPSMDALADLASMQHVQQTARQQSVGQRPSIR